MLTLAQKGKEKNLMGARKNENLWSQIIQEFLITILRVANSQDDRKERGCILDRCWVISGNGTELGSDRG